MLSRRVLLKTSAVALSVFFLPRVRRVSAAERTPVLVALYLRGGAAVSISSCLGNALEDAAALIKAEIGVRAICVDLGGWHHTDTADRIDEVGGSGGRVLLAGGTWPGLATDKLYRGQDLAVTTDFRSVFAEALYRHLRVSTRDVAAILPGFTIEPAGFPGLYA